MQPNISLREHKMLGMRDFEYYAAHNLKIKPKQGGVAPLLLNSAQRYLHREAQKQLKETGKVRIIVLKGRQQGISTYVEGRFYWRVTHREGVRAFILTHLGDSTKTLFDMVEHYHNAAPPDAQPSVDKSNSKELIFDKLESGYKVGTAGSRGGTGRGGTVQYFHGSEVAFWDNAQDHATGVMQSIAELPNTEIFLESTANGVGNYFHKMWQQAVAGKGAFRAVFIPWYWQDEYEAPYPQGWKMTDAEAEYARLYLHEYDDHTVRRKMYWRANKIVELEGDEAYFDQEYPATADLAFRNTGGESYIGTSYVMRARNNVDAGAYGPIVGGFDPAGEGKDRTAFVVRQGRVVFHMETWDITKPMECVGLCTTMIQRYALTKLFIDVIGLGSGIYDRLVELGYGGIVVPVNFANKSIYTKKYVNKRAECWGEMREWLMNEDLPPQIPDDDELHADLTGPTYKRNSAGQLVLEKKEDMLKRGIRSPDIGDALALTFAMPLGNMNTDQHAIAVSSHDQFVQEQHDGFSTNDIAEGSDPLW